MFKTILAASFLTVALASGASAATMAPMKKMDHSMKKMDHSMAMKKKCGHGMVMSHGKCMDKKMMMMKHK